MNGNLRGILVANLPTTLIHTTYITGEIGFQYLWIDSLCIIQARSASDKVAIADWQDQASKITDVYGNAFLTISSAGASDKYKGCFIPRSPIKHTCTISLADSASPSMISVRPPTSGFPYYDNLLNDRAWTSQKVVLSQRFLLYKRNQITFMCSARKQMESK